MIKTRGHRLLLACFLAGVLFLTTILVSSPLEVAAGGGLPPRLPPRPGEPETPTPVPIYGASIQLHSSTSMPGAWTVVEWQNEHGEWYVVTGWQGNLDDGDNDKKRWWVYTDDFGSSPFRWQVYDSKGGELLATSESFELPTQNFQVVTVDIELP